MLRGNIFGITVMHFRSGLRRWRLRRVKSTFSPAVQPFCFLEQNSLWFRFREDCLGAGKYLLVWTINDPAYMMEVRMRMANPVVKFTCN